MQHIYSIDGIIPVIHPSSFVHPSATVIGDVIIGPDCYVGPGASLRGDFGRIILGRGSNFQDTCVAHGFPHSDTEVEEDGHIGHGAVIHGCNIGKNAMVGMNAVIMDDAVIGESSIVAASAFVKAKFSCPPRSLVMGAPAKVTRELSEQEVAWKSKGTVQYQELTRRCLASLKPVTALTEPEPNRKRLEFEGVVPLNKIER